MLTPEQLDKMPDNLVRLYAQLEEDIIVNMAERINALNLFIPAADWQFQKVKEMGNSYDMILEKLSGSTGKTEDMLSDMMTAAASESMKQEDEIHKSAGKEVPPLAQSAALVATLNAGMRKTAGYFENLCRTTAFNGSKQFADALDRAYMQVISGAFSKDEAIKSAVKDLAKQGITAAVYKNGRRMSLESAVRMNVITGINQTCAELQLQRADEVGCDLVAVSAHAGARPSHALWQGKVYSRSGNHKKYPEFESSTGYGTVTGLCGANCRHTFYPFYEGISVNAYTKKELDEMNRKTVDYNGQKLTEYEASQVQRKIERNIRRWKREMEATKVIGIGTDEAAAKLKYWRLEMNSFISQTGFKRQYAREDIFAPKVVKNTKKSNGDMQNQFRNRREAYKQRMAQKEALKIDFSKMDKKQLATYAKENLATHFDGLSGASEGYAQEAVRVIKEFEERMGGKTIDGLAVKFGGTPAGTYAKYDDATKTLLLKKTGSLDAFAEKQMKENMRYKTKWHTEKDYYATTSYSGTIWHELGHAVDIDTNQALSRKLSSSAALNEASVKISAYAGTSQGVRVTKRSEAWAENFAAYMEGGAKAKEVPEEIVKMIEGYFDDANKRKISKTVAKIATEEKSIGKPIGYAGVFRKAESIDEAKEYAIDMLYLEYAEYDKISLDAANMLNYEIARVYDVFGNLNEAGYLRDIRYYSKRADWEAMYNKTWNGIYMRNLSSKNFMKKLKKNAEEQREMGFWSTDAAEHGIRHELGHAVYHYLLGNNADKNDKITALRESIMKKHGITKWDMNNDSRERIKQAGDSISYYALKDNSEFIAEAVAEYMTGNPREISQKAIDILLEE